MKWIFLLKVWKLRSTCECLKIAAVISFRATFLRVRCKLLILSYISRTRLLSLDSEQAFIPAYSGAIIN